MDEKLEPIVKKLIDLIETSITPTITGTEQYTKKIRRQIWECIEEIFEDELNQCFEDRTRDSDLLKSAPTYGGL